ncbi:hypothetical protein CN692_10775 [Bacillus sp. AFS002410]|uniref:toprim domain-containing protein n=1 Tax=Bacillus sp. AFS002410 TaxID=2033481 RepID=UPI000BF0F7DA|nr:toprim domain-containing protein [Bacillus sp. AFS002410]PEJ58000.1 hypothetical protein CN692_10775 [Bacillus sp. AFS002410]
MATSKYVSSDEILSAKQIHLIDYLEAKGEHLKKESGASYYRHQEHDSLVFKDNLYYWNSKQEKGVGAISFAMMYYRLTFPEAVKEINDLKYNEKNREQRQIELNKKQGPFRYPAFLDVKETDAIQNYLVNERKINPRLVDWLIMNEFIVQDQRKNVVFKWKEQGGKGEVVGANRQGTIKMDNRRGSFKQILPNGKEHSGFTIDIGKPTKVIAFESPIDLLSYWSIKQNNLTNVRLVSMDGLKPKTIVQSHIDAKKEGHAIEKWVLAVDNDEAGWNFIETIKKLVKPSVLEVDLPSEKDWNDQLKKQMKIANMKQLNMKNNTELVLER